jgi:hypothetical protein
VDQFEAYIDDWFESLEEVPAQIQLDNIWARVSDIYIRRRLVDSKSINQNYLQLLELRLYLSDFVEADLFHNLARDFDLVIQRSMIKMGRYISAIFLADGFDKALLYITCSCGRNERCCRG